MNDSQNFNPTKYACMTVYCKWHHSVNRFCTQINSRTMGRGGNQTTLLHNPNFPKAEKNHFYSKIYHF